MNICISIYLSIYIHIYIHIYTYICVYNHCYTIIYFSYASTAWISNLIIGANGGWDLRVRGSIARRSDGIINSSPVTSSSPIIRLQHGCNHTIRIPGMFMVNFATNLCSLPNLF